MLPPETTIATFRAPMLRWMVGTFFGMIATLLCLAGVGFIILAYVWLGKLSVKYTITNQRLIVNRGLFFINIDEIELYRVKDVQVDFSLLNQTANIGTITVTYSVPNAQGGTLVMRHIEDATALRETLRNIIQDIRVQRGVREIDGAPMFAPNEPPL